MRDIDILGVPVDHGANRRGVDMGPSAIRYAGLFHALRSMGLSCRDLGDIPVPVPEFSDNRVVDRERNRAVLGQVTRDLFRAMSDSLAQGRFPVVLGGDHSLAMGSVLGARKVLGDMGLLWIDAHGDFNTLKTSPTGNYHGMALSAVLGAADDGLASLLGPDAVFVSPERTVLVGVRDLDPGEARRLLKSGVTVLTMEDIDLLGMREAMRKALDIVGRAPGGYHLSFDMDVLAPSEAPGVGTPVAGGLTFREAHLAVEMVAATPGLRSMEFVEVNPVLDRKNDTAGLAVSLICSALGKRILGIVREPGEA